MKNVWELLPLIAICAVCAMAFGVVYAGLYRHELVPGCTGAPCDEIRSLEWETILAGLLGLTGGAFALISVNRQIKTQERHREEDQKLKIELYFNSLATVIPEARKVVEAVENEVSSNQFDTATANECVINLQTVELPDAVEGLKANIAISATKTDLEYRKLLAVLSQMTTPNIQPIGASDVASTVSKNLIRELKDLEDAIHDAGARAGSVYRRHRHNNTP